jgi:Mn-dependent DtxR family transcriptional regulator
MACVAAGVLALIAGFYKELLVVSFDPQLAASLGFAPRLVRYVMMAVLSLTVVTAFTSVGAMLVVAMLIVPPATAYLLTHRLPVMFVYSTATGAISSLAGYHIGYWLDVSISGAIVSVGCGLFTLAFLFAPGQGLVAGLVRRGRLRMRMSQENIVRHMLKLSGGEPRAAVASEKIAAAVQISRLHFQWALGATERRGWVESSPEAAGSLRLTDRGFIQAQRLDRAHRLWETFLVEQVGVPSDHVHPTAEKVEHLLSDQFVERVDDVLGHPVTDPHGAPIPRSPMTDRSPGVFTLSKLRAGDRARVVGLVDTPPAAVNIAAHDRLPTTAVAELGLTLGQAIEVVKHDPAIPSWTIEYGAGEAREVPHELADLVLVQLESASA